MNELPLYVCHKEVRALKIAEIGFKGEDVRITPEDTNYAPFVVSVENRPKPEVGWYFVQYDNGYHSFSPAKAFEDGYTLKEQS